MSRTNKKKASPSPEALEEAKKLSDALNFQFRRTVEKVRRIYGHVGQKMADAALGAARDQRFVDWLFVFYSNTWALIGMTPRPEANPAYLEVMSAARLLHKMEFRLPFNVLSHAEEVLGSNRYLRRFIREFFFDIYAHNTINN